MRLETLRLRSFKGVSRFELRADGENVTILGDNAAGKTTIFDAWCWLMFGTDSTGAAEFEIKTLTPEGRPIPSLDHEVEAAVRLPDGRTRKLAKCYREKYVKRRGSASTEFSGHTTDHFVDGVPVKAQEFSAAVAELAGSESAFRLLTDPLAFAERLHWKERRELLLEVCGDVSDEDVLGSSRELVDLGPILKEGRTPDGLRRIYSHRRAEINKELERIPIRIDEAERALPEMPERDEKLLSQTLRDLTARRQDLESRRARLAEGGGISEAKSKLSDAKRRLAEARFEAKERAETEARELRRRLVSAQEARDEVKADVARWRRRLSDHEDEIERLGARYSEFADQFEKVRAERFEAPDVPDACASCGQPLPPEEVEEARARAEAEWKERRAQKLEALASEGRLLEGRLKELEEPASEAQGQIKTSEARLREKESAVESARSELEAARAVAPDPDADPRCAELSDEVDEARAAVEAAADAPAAEIARIDREIVDLDAQAQALRSDLSRHEARRRGEARIKELSAERRRLSVEFEDLERRLYLLDEFVRAKVRLLEDRINSRFRIARFRLFRILINGALEETCEVAVDGVPYPSLNHGARIQVGLDAIRTLADHYDFRPPVWVDQAESITRLPEVNSQVIRLEVSPGDSELRVSPVASTPNRKEVSV